jgi:hypothetical protein
MPTTDDLLVEVVSQVTVMVSAGIDIDTVRFFILTKASELDLSGLERTMFIGMMEEALQKLYNK